MAIPRSVKLKCPDCGKVCKGGVGLTAHMLGRHKRQVKDLSPYIVDGREAKPEYSGAKRGRKPKQCQTPSVQGTAAPACCPGCGFDLTRVIILPQGTSHALLVKALDVISRFS